jgi:hypothetical protein
MDMGLSLLYGTPRFRYATLWNSYILGLVYSQALIPHRIPLAKLRPYPQYFPSTLWEVAREFFRRLHRRHKSRSWDRALRIILWRVEGYEHDIERERLARCTYTHIAFVFYHKHNAYHEYYNFLAHVIRVDVRRGE